MSPAALAEALRDAARAGEPVAYLDLADRLMAGEAHRIHRLTSMLEELVRADHAAGRPLLAALAVGRAGLPGRGFFQLLVELGLYEGPDQGPAAAAWHAAELGRALRYWGRQPD
jgi:hypothetical protein